MLPYQTLQESKDALGRELTLAETLWFNYSAKKPDFVLHCHNTLFLCLFYSIAPIPFLLIELSGSKKLNKYKIQPTVKRSFWEMFKCYKYVMRTFIIAVGPLQIISYPTIKWIGIRTGLPLPSGWELFWQLLVYFVIEDFSNYWIHRMLHCKWAFENIHKVHHEYKAPIGLSAPYAHWAEILILGIPSFLGPALAPGHITTYWLWFILRQLEAIETHSGYEFPWSPTKYIPFYGGATYHDYHHYVGGRSQGNFASVFTYCDYIYGTYKGYQYRNRMYKKISPTYTSIGQNYKVDLVFAKGCIQREKQALLDFQADLVDYKGMLSSWITEDCCQWKGIRCSNFTGHVVMLDLHGHMFTDLEDDTIYYIKGNIHKSLIELQQLKYLNLSGNIFEDIHIPDFFGSLINLRYLDLSDSGFGGKIPSQLGSLSHLKYLNLGWNHLEGSIPYQLGNLTNLQFLSLKGNSLIGNIPSQLGKLSKLQELYLGGYYGALKIGDGNLSGGQGKWLSNLTSLTHLQLWWVSDLNSSHSWLQMIGKIPKLRELSLSGCTLSDHFILSLCTSKFNFSTSLSVLDLSSNSFTSSVIFQWVSNFSSNLVELDLSGNLMKDPPSNHFATEMISKLPKLRKLWLYNCLLSDNFLLSQTASNFNSSTSLSILDLSSNSFTSSMIFQWVSNISSNLVELDLTENQLEAHASDDSIMVMNSLESLVLDYNRLKGGVLKSFVNICTLRMLSMSGNNLTGDLPSVLDNLSSGCVRNSLQELYLGSNKITGSLTDLSMFSSLKTLDLSVNRLTGKIPEGIKLPSQLESLSIGSNSLEGGIPKSFGNACTLRSLVMSNISLSEELPVIIHHLSGCARYSLHKLDLSMNQINGTLPDLSIFSSLKRLDLSENRLNGKIPEDIQFLTQLEELYMSSNSLNGVISDSHFANMSKLDSLDLSDNSLALAFTQNWIPPFQLSNIGLGSCKLGPAFPRWLQTQDNFQSLDISNAGISDIVPEWFWARLALQDWTSINISHNNLKGVIPNYPPWNTYYSISLASNQFEGPIPPFLRGSLFLDLSKNRFSDSHSFLCTIGAVKTLYKLDLSSNQLHGQIPNCWIRFITLTYLDLSHNNFSGKIPTSMGTLVELQALLLRNNSLTEEIPFSLMNCTKLVMLDAGENRLSGHIPSWIGSKLQELQVLTLGRNHFFGSLPLELCYLKSIQLLDLSLNNLSGRIPKCFKNFTSMAQKTSLRDYAGHQYLVNSNRVSGNVSYNLNAFLMWKGVEQMFKNNALVLLKSIDLSSNQFSEDIPVEIENLFELVSLNLSRNNLTGEIPSNIGKLASLVLAISNIIVFFSHSK